MNLEPRTGKKALTTILFLLFTALSLPAQFNTRIYYFTNGAVPFPLKLTNGQSVTLTSTSNVPLYRGRGLALWVQSGGTNAASVTNLTSRFNLRGSPLATTSGAGTNWSTSTPLQWLSIGPGNGARTDYTNVTSDFLDNAAQIRLETILWPAIGGIIGADTNTIWVSNVWATVFP